MGGNKESHNHTVYAESTRSGSAFSGFKRHEGENIFRYGLRRLLITKSIDDLNAQAAASQMRRTLSAVDLVLVGIGAIIGTGIFVLTGQAAANNAGPAIVVSFIVAGVAAAFAALSYAEMASMIPIAGSAYTYSYATLGEFLAWIIGWDLILEYLVGAATVSVGWSAYVVAFFRSAFGVDLGTRWTDSPLSWDDNQFHVTGNYINLPAILISLVVTFILVIGIRESARVNSAIVILKVFVVVLFILAACKNVDPKNYEPFFPPNEGSFGKFGATGMLQAATMVFFAYIGFDAVSTTAQEAKNPQRDLPIGITLSLVICTVLYIAVCLVLTGVVPYTKLGVASPISVAIDATGMRWLGIIVELGAIAGLTSVMLVMLMGQPRIFYAMAHDGLFPAWAAKIHPRFKTPYITTIISGITCAILGGILPVSVLGELTSVGTLLAFVLVNLGVMVLRFKKPDLPRRFRVPGGPIFVPVVGAALSLALLCTATVQSIERLFIWMAIGLVIYALYGCRKSKVAQGQVVHVDLDDIHKNNDKEISETQEISRVVDETNA